ncbi:AMP-binding protein [Anaeromyxobacter diazotrophicus]|uniref:AMP-binding protein n=1 Tax=Anaeromyxobacter diazotrophicus TaxID=2590199 RepID=A0A7I9VIW9_9BACT|nr:AMP-binding protein [Anaeromyxobacter diazotrophicus]GEJ56315.1 AMP-binding protein [Anaeromyxobacter diazotrophicus]
MPSTEAFRRARDFLLQHRDDYEAAYRGFRWPVLDRFNWALDWFDVLAEGNRQTALHIVEDDGREVKLGYGELAERSNRVAVFFRRLGVQRGDRLLMMLDNSVPIWEVMLAAMKLGAVIIPATSLLTPEDLRDRLDRGKVKHVVTDPAGAEKLRAVDGGYSKVVVGEKVPGWTPYEQAYAEPAIFFPKADTYPNHPVLLYFTSGTTAKPKLVLHTHASYPVGHLSTMYWLGVRAGDVHMNISSPGWGKHAWSNFFAPFNAGATVFVHNYARFQARRTLEVLARHEITTLCAPPTVWRLVIQEDLAAHPVKLREALSAGEPLNPEVIDRIQRAWGVAIRDGYGQTETTCQIGNSPGQRMKPGSMGRPMPGFSVKLLDGDGREADEGELALGLTPRPTGLMAGYLDDPELTEFVTRDGYYRTGDVASRDADGYITYVGRSDDVFKSSDYRISPFELESALIEHEAVAEAAVVPSPDPVRGLVPKAFCILRPGHAPTRELALELFRFLRRRLAPYKRVRRLEFADLPKTISGKIRRVELRRAEAARSLESHGSQEFWQDDFPELKS